MRDPSRLRKLRQVPQEIPAFSQNYLRYLMANRHRNGFQRCLVRIGSRFFVDLDELGIWVSAQPQESHREL
jgi:hypothetical protein